MDTNIRKGISEGMQVQIELASKVGNEYIVMHSTKIDICGHKENLMADPLYSMLIVEMTKYGNMSIDCPIEKGNYFVRGFHADDENMMVKMAPYGDYRMDVDLKHLEKGSKEPTPVFDMKMYATFMAE
ncbi:uncharacterized protein LOC129760835 [Uranotaenia lowii]|uniref:uncharacterized protein LOC129760835 n=1 Tax=Uranotaenia lowii TaxID=190385 RepID=UPI00247A10A4|nr:uncharacterized protein LOC129760835 [Uranotaenia lowii]